jgi:hypothetical protein
VSFLSALENDGKKVIGAIETGLRFAVNISPAAGEIVSLFNPPVGALISMIGTKVIEAEAQITAAKSGAQKKAAVMAGLNDALTLAYALQGKTVPPEAVASASNAVDAFVLLMNSVHQATTAKG